MSMTTKLQKLDLTQNENIPQVNEYIDLIAKFWSLFQKKNQHTVE